MNYTVPGESNLIMKALMIDRFGGPEVYRLAEDIPVPEPGEGEVQIKVDGAGMNPVDFKIREGQAKPFLPETLPAVTLREFSGVVSKLGSNTGDVRVGDHVYGITEKGAAAEFTVAKTTSIGPRPASMDPADAAVVPLAAMTAWQALFVHGDLQLGQRVLIHAAAGGVGTYAVQLAKWKGAYVIGTVSPDHFNVVRELGADEVFDYQKGRFEDTFSDVDLVLHSIGEEELDASLKVLKPGGKLVAISAQPDVEKAKAEGKTATAFMMQPDTEQLRQLCNLIEDLKVRPVIDTIVPMTKAKEAMAELEAGHVLGKIGIRIS